MKVYGFGSYFSSKKIYQDIDILIIHDSISESSCLKAINLKKCIKKMIDRASVTILSKSSEKECDFINVSKAILLGVVDENEIPSSISEIVRKTESYKHTYLRT